MARPYRSRWLIAALLWMSSGTAPRLQSPLDKQLLMAAGRGNLPAVVDLLGQGANVNAVNNYGTSPLFIAADRANVELVKLLLERGADTNATELQWGKSPLSIVAQPSSDNKAPEARAQIVKLLVDKGAGADGQPLADLIRAGYHDAARAIVSGPGEKSPPYLNQALAAARRAGQDDLAAFLVKSGARDPRPEDSPGSPERLKQLAGVYRSAGGAELALRTTEQGDQLVLERAGQHGTSVFPVGLTILKTTDLKIVLAFKANPLPPAQVTLREAGQSEVFTRASTGGSK
jgi:hypothetical protein